MGHASKWVREHLAVDAYDKPVGVYSESAVRWNLPGSIQRCSPNLTIAIVAMDAVRRNVDLKAEGVKNIGEWNQLPTVEQSHIVAVLLTSASDLE